MSVPDKKKFKVLHIITRLIVGGAQENTLLTVSGLNQKDAYDVWLLSGPTQGPEGSLEEKAKLYNKFVILPQLVRNVNPLLDFIALIRLYIFIKKQGFEIVHTHSSKAGILGRLAAKLAGVPVIIHTVHGLPFFKSQNLLVNKFYIILEKLVGLVTDKIICVSDTLIEDAVGVNIAPRTKFIRIYSGIDLNNFKNDIKQKDLTKEKLGIPKQSPVIGKVARLFHFKGHKYFFEAAQIVKTKVPAVRFLLIGDGILKKRLIRHAQRLGITQNIIFAGLISPDEISKYIQAMDVIAHTSLHEGLPRAVVQAHALGIPAVCFDVDGTKDIVQHGVSSFLVKPKDINSLAQHLITLIEDKEKAAQMGRKAQQFATKAFSAQIMVEGIDQIYKQTLLSVLCGN